jgi:quercetin dioxygenase-like cupin family protein
MNVRQGDHGTYSIERLYESDALRASILTLAPGQGVPPHHHSDVTDHMFIIGGTLTVEFHELKETRTFEAGRNCMIRPGVVHSTLNQAETTCRFLLVQPGRFDFLAVETAP